MTRFDLDIVEVVQSYGIALKQNGNLWLGLCPFHDDNTPSLTIYPATNTFHCFACQENGTVLWFISKIEKIPLEDVQARYKDTVLHAKLKIIGRHKETDFKVESLFLIAQITRDFLKKHYDKLKEVMSALEKIDNVFDKLDTVSHLKGAGVIDRFREYLGKLVKVDEKEKTNG